MGKGAGGRKCQEGGRVVESGGRRGVVTQRGSRAIGMVRLESEG